MSTQPDTLHNRITDDDRRFLDLVREHHRVEVDLNDPHQGTYRSHVGGLLDIIDRLAEATRAALAAAQPAPPFVVPPGWSPAEPGERAALLMLIYDRTLNSADLLADAILAAGFRRSRPEATHTITAEQVHAARERADARASRWSGRWAEHYLAALGVTVADTPAGS